MAAIIRDDLPHVGHAHELEGYLHGNVPASLIFVDGPPGSGPRLHRHPYPEISANSGRSTSTSATTSLPSGSKMNRHPSPARC